MGKGDIKTRRGKITNRSYGKRRPWKKKDNAAVQAPVAVVEKEAAPKPKKKAAAKKSAEATEEKGE